MDATTITVSLPTDLLREAERIASERNVPLDKLMAETLTKLVEFESKYADAKANHLAILDQSFDLGTNGKRLGPRDDLHERR
jgi:hypothetical protein